MLIYARIEDGVIARVKAASDSNALGYRLAHVDSYGGEFDDERFWESFRKFPAAWVTVAGDKPRRLGPRRFECALKVAVMVGARNVRGERQSRRGTVADPGSYQLLDDVRRLLIGQDFGLPISALTPGPTRTLFNTRLANEGRSIMAAEFETTYQLRLPDPLTSDDDPDLLTVGLDYLLQDPADSAIDASDIVTLRP